MPATPASTFVSFQLSGLLPGHGHRAHEEASAGHEQGGERRGILFKVGISLQWEKYTYGTNISNQK